MCWDYADKKPTIIHFAGTGQTPANLDDIDMFG
jgi:hypothetical protein